MVIYSFESVQEKSTSFPEKLKEYSNLLNEHEVTTFLSFA